MFLFHKLKSTKFGSYALIFIIIAMFFAIVYPASAFSKEPSASFSWESFDEITTNNICKKVSEYNNREYNHEVIRKNVYMGGKESLILCITPEKDMWMMFRFIENLHTDEKTIELIKAKQVKL